MRLRSRVTIAAPPERVWPLLADPAQMSRWNPKLISTKRTRSGPVSRLERYSLTYRMSGRETAHDAEVVEYEPPTRLSIRLRTSKRKNPDSVSATETYVLRKVSGGTSLIQILELPIPWLLSPIVWLIHRFGTPTDEPYLERLKDLAERETVSSA